MRKTFDVCIIGGGIIGTAIAYYTARKGLRPLILERSTFGSQSTQAAGGMLGAQVETNTPDPLFQFAVQSRAMFQDLQAELKELSGYDIELQTAGMIRLAVSEEDRASLLAKQEWQTQFGQRAEWMEDADIRKMAGDLFGATYGGLFLPDDLQVRSMAMLQALLAGARKLGAEVQEHTEVINFLQEGGRVIGVETGNGPFYADQTVLAAGAWSGLISRRIGLDLPVFPVKGQSILAKASSPITPFTVFTHGTYFVPKISGHLYIGATMEQVGFDKTHTLQGINRILTDATRILPSIKQLGIHSTLVGLRPGSADGLPYIGSIEGIEGLHVASGHLRNGILLAPLTGLVVSELLTGQPVSVDLTPFSISR
ncbi:glycine oxidase ThiO [Effusibacillus dendaii]|uniref:glycine oxidase n=1 Tax=Effusibacillus dendaii TaxID=2743772 RepID=A0A7I8D8H6_9BACL|nr:glycine oxidase ThiO [Effusibacillus dendaii]BCJ86424.1 glycine oxidase [Effusibacillus dendaii]